jgi:hypothetical protein
MLGKIPDLSKCLPLSQDVIKMGRSRLTVRQGDVQRVMKAAKVAGLDVSRVEVDPSTGKIVIVVKEDGNEVKKTINPLHSAPLFWSGRKGPK